MPADGKAFSWAEQAAPAPTLRPLLNQNDSENALLLDKDFVGEQI
jgi:hypothetical protein